MGIAYLAEETEALARSVGKTKCEVVRDALRRQLQITRVSALHSYGREHAERLGIGPEDAEAVVDELRSRRR